MPRMSNNPSLVFEYYLKFRVVIRVHFQTEVEASWGKRN